MALQPSIKPKLTVEPLPRGSLLDRVTGSISNAWRTFFEARGRQNGEIISGVNRNADNIVQLETEYTAADGSLTSAYIAADAVVAADAASANTELSTTLTSAYTAADTALQANIDQEATARTTADTANATSIAAVRASAAGARVENLLLNTTFSQGLEAWLDTWPGNVSLPVSRRVEPIGSWSTDGRVAQIVITGTPAAGQFFDLIRNWGNAYTTTERRFAIPVESGERLGAQIRGAIHRGQSISLIVGFLDQAGGSRQEFTLDTGGNGFDGFDGFQGDIANYDLLSGYVTAPYSGYAYLIARGTTTNEANPNFWVRDPMLWRASADETGSRTYVPSLESSDHAEAVSSILKEAFVGSDGKALARLVLTAAAGGNPALLELLDGDGGSSIALKAAEIFFGSDTTFEDSDDTIYVEKNSYRLRILGPFGSSSDLVLWYGGTGTALNSETKTNGVFALATDGQIYLGSNSYVDPLRFTSAPDSQEDDSTSTTFRNFTNIGSNVTGGTTPYTHSFAIRNDPANEWSLANASSGNAYQRNVSVNTSGQSTCLVEQTVTDADGETLTLYHSFSWFSTA